MQNNLDIFAEWNDTWQGYLNISKYKHLALGVPSNDQFYTLAPNAPFQEVSEECDLGITLTNDFKFSKHVNLSIHKVNKVLIKHTEVSIVSFPCTVFSKLYVSLVRPHLNYASIIWNPKLLKDIRSLVVVK